MTGLPPLRAVTCHGCGKTIYLAKDDRGMAQRLDAAPPVYVQIRGDGKEPMVMKISGLVSHSAICPQASAMSKKNDPEHTPLFGEKGNL